MAQYPSSVVRGDVRADIDVGLRAHMNKIYGLMAIAMMITFGVAYVVGTNATLLATFFQGPMRWVVMFAPLVAILIMSFGIHRMSATTANIVFYGFAGLMGLSIAWIFAVFTGASIAVSFLATAVAFLGLSLYGYTTKSDLSGIGRFAIMALIGVIVLSIAQFFFGSFGSTFAFLMNIAILLIFSALTAYDTQRLKEEYVAFSTMGSEGQAILEKGAIMGALSLYLNFINMFLVLLQFLGAQQE